jgi:chromosome segregation ATPase
MKWVQKALLLFCVAVLQFGCAGQTSDPRQGGLFSYNPEAYEQRAQERKERLAAIEQGNQSLRSESSKLETEKTTSLKNKESAGRELQAISASVSSMDKNIRSVQAKTAAQKNEQQRILAELNTIKSATKRTDNIDDPEEKRLEIERLKKRRDDLEKEAANLMKL